MPRSATVPPTPPAPLARPARSRADLRWSLHLTARSSIAHGGETRGTITLLRREAVMTVPGSLLQIPIISGNSLRGRLRRVGEELLRDELCYEGTLSSSAAHALRGGGALAKVSGEPLSGNRLQRVRTFVPLIGVFGAAAGGCIIDGALSVGKVVPHLQETAHITGVASSVSAFQAVQLESYTRLDDGDSHAFFDVLPAAALELGPDGTPGVRPETSSRQMIFQVETFPAGTEFSTWLQLRRPSDIEASFLADILGEYSRHATLGGRSAIGHGQVNITARTDSGHTDPLLWRKWVRKHRSETIDALNYLT